MSKDKDEVATSSGFGLRLGELFKLLGIDNNSASVASGKRYDKITEWRRSDIFRGKGEDLLLFVERCCKHVNEHGDQDKVIEEGDVKNIAGWLVFGIDDCWPEEKNFKKALSIHKKSIFFVVDCYTSILNEEFNKAGEVPVITKSKKELILTYLIDNVAGNSSGDSLTIKDEDKEFIKALINLR